MSAYVVWMDSETAKIYHINGLETSIAKVQNKNKDQHAHNKRDLKDKSPHKFYLRIFEQLNSLKDSILLVGPGKSKNHFVSYLEDHKKFEVAHRVIGTESMDHPTDAQVIAFARKYFPSGMV